MNMYIPISNQQLSNQQQELTLRISVKAAISEPTGVMYPDIFCKEKKIHMIIYDLTSCTQAAYSGGAKSHHGVVLAFRFLRPKGSK